ncbi:MAG: NAD-dependent epimerase/dehydratase family protein [Phycisphaerales bacterium]
MARKNVLVTGGAGFIGSHLADRLVSSDAHVTILDDFSNGLDANLQGPAGEARVIRGSICDRAALSEAIDGAELVFHLAAIGSVPRSLEFPELYEEVNVSGTLRVLQAARTAGVRRVVYSASSSAYGNTPSLPKVESMRPDPVSPYAFTKLAGEHLMRSWSACFGLETVSLRYFNIFGPRQRHDSPYAAVIPKFAKQLRSGQRPTLFGDGTQSRDFTFVENAVHANLLAAAAPAATQGQVINVACGTRFSLLTLLERMASIMGIDCEPEFMPTRPGDVRDSEADISAAAALIGYSVQVPFEEGLRRTLQAMQVGSAARRD